MSDLVKTCLAALELPKEHKASGSQWPYHEWLALTVVQLRRELKIQQGVNDMAYIPHRHLADQNERLRAKVAALESAARETGERQ